jgi:putative ABC transport system permease protein
MMGTLYLGWKYVTYHRWKTGLLIAAISLILFLPPALMLVIDRGAQSLNARADATPLLLGAPGSPLELTLSSLYFRTTVPATLNYGASDAIDPVLAEAVPVYVRFRSRQFPIVGTNSAYLDYRRLALSSGRGFALLGECVIGANVARALALSVGDSIISSPESLFDIAGVYPLKMKVVGILQPSLTPDDQAILTDLKTTWVIEGLGHGHQDLNEAASPDLVLSRDASKVTANAAVVQFNEITDANRDSFHFHGDNSGYPVSGLIVIPRDEKALAILLGRFLGTEGAQLIRPTEVISELLATVFTVQAFVLLIMGLVGLATLITAILVFALSIRLRARERLTLQRMGAARSNIMLMMGSETLFVLLASTMIAAALLGLTQLVGTEQLVLLLSQW